MSKEYIPKMIQLGIVEDAIAHHDRLSVLLRDAQLPPSYREKLRKAILLEQEVNAKIQLGRMKGEKSISARKNIVKIFRELSNEYQEDLEIKKQLCVAISNLSSNYLYDQNKNKEEYKNNVDKAKLLLNEALVILDFPTNEPWLLDLRIQVLTKLATANRITDSPDSIDEAFKHIDNAITLSKHALDQHQEVAELYRSAVTVHIEKYEIYLRINEQEKATEQLKQAVEMARAYKSKKPSSHFAMHTFGNVSLQLILRLYNKKLQVPAELVIEAEESLRAAVDRNPLNFLYTFTLSELLFVKSLIYYKENKYGSFQVAADEYIDIIREINKSPFLDSGIIDTNIERIKGIKLKLNSIKNKLKEINMGESSDMEH